MNLIQRAMQLVFGKGISKAADKRRQWRERNVTGQRFMKNPVSRQTLRASLRASRYQSTSGDNRRQRRALARALASADFKQVRGSNN